MSRPRGRPPGSGALAQLQDATQGSEPDLLDSFADLAPPQTSRLSQSEALLNKVVKDRTAKEQARRARERVLAERRNHAAAAEAAAPPGDIPAAKRARFEESREAMSAKARTWAPPPSLRPCLHAPQAQPVEPCLEGHGGPAAACAALLGDQAASPPPSAAAQELLLGGWLRQHHSMRGETLPPGLQAHLLELVAHAEQAQVAQSAFDLLAATLGDDGGGGLLGRQAPLPATAGFYGPEQAGGGCSCSLDDAAFAAALAGLGYRCPREGAAGPAAPQPSQPGAAAAARPPLHRLRLVLQLLAAAARAQAAGAFAGLAGGGLQRLLAATLDLRLDPAACLLATELEAAATALLAAFPEGEWARRLPGCARALAAAGGSHRGALESLRRLRGASPRAGELCAAAAARCLTGLLQPQGKPQAAQQAPAELLLDGSAGAAEALLAAQPWFAAGGLAAAAGVRSGALDLWQLHTALELGDLLLQPPGRRAAGGAFRARWEAFCQKLGSQLPQDERGAALKLLITQLLARGHARGL